MSNTVIPILLSRTNRVKRLMEGREFDSKDERDAMIFALYRFSDSDFNIVWAWFLKGGEV